MNRKVSVAPMMDCTDRHERYFLRLISKNVLLYTEMIVSEAIDRGDKKKLLSLKDFSLIKKHYINLNLPMKIGEFFHKNEINKIISFIKKDKKNFDKKINLILLKRIGATTKPN